MNLQELSAIPIDKRLKVLESALEFSNKSNFHITYLLRYCDESCTMIKNYQYNGFDVKTSEEEYRNYFPEINGYNLYPALHNISYTLFCAVEKCRINIRKLIKEYE